MSTTTLSCGIPARCFNAVRNSQKRLFMHKTTITVVPAVVVPIVVSSITGLVLRPINGFTPRWVREPFIQQGDYITHFSVFLASIDFYSFHVLGHKPGGTGVEFSAVEDNNKNHKYVKERVRACVRASVWVVCAPQQ